MQATWKQPELMPYSLIHTGGKLCPSSRNGWLYSLDMHNKVTESRAALRLGMTAVHDPRDMLYRALIYGHRDISIRVIRRPGFIDYVHSVYSSGVAHEKAKLSGSFLYHD